MASVRFPEAFVSYTAASSSVANVVDELREVLIALPTAGTKAEEVGLLNRRRLLEIQAGVAEGDSEAQAQRYDAAIVRYRAAARLILAFLDAQAGTWRLPKVFDLDAPQRRLLEEVSVRVLANLQPAARAESVVSLPGAGRLDPVAFGAQLPTQVTPKSGVSDDVLQRAEVGTTALREGRWAEAAEQFSSALDGLGASEEERELRAALLLDLGAVEVQRNRPDAAVSHLSRAREEFTALGDELGAAEALHNTALARLKAGQGQEAISTLNEARAAAESATLRNLLIERPAPPAPPAPGGAPAPVGGPGAGGVVAVLPPIGRLPLNPIVIRRLPIEIERSVGIGRVGIDVRRPIAGSIGIGAEAVAAPQPSVEQLAAGLGSDDLQLRVRPIRAAQAATQLPLETDSQARQGAFTRQLTFDGQVISWAAGATPSVEELRQGLWTSRIGSTDLARVGFAPDGVADLAARLPQLYHFVLAIKMGGCHHELGNYGDAEREYLRAASWENVNLPLEAPDLWRRLVESLLAAGDALFRAGDPQRAREEYEKVVLLDGTAPASALYTTTSLAPTGAVVAGWLGALAAANDLPELNPAVAGALLTIRTRLRFIEAGLDFFGNEGTVVPPFTYSYLYDVSSYLAGQAVQAEQRYIDFFTRYEQGQMTRTDLQNATELAAREVDAARAREREAAAMLEAADIGVQVSAIRADNAQEMLDQFNDTSWESEALAGMIARGSAFTGSDVTLNYTIDGTKYSGDKHEVLQAMTRRQTEISNDLQRTRMEQTAEELAASQGVAEAQSRAARARLQGAQLQTQTAAVRVEHAEEMLDAFNSQVFNPEQWLAMAQFMQGLSSTALDRAIEVARLMERAYNFENLDDRSVIRSSYSVASTGGLLAGALLQSDIESFLHHRVTSVKHKPVPVKWALSLAERFPGPFELGLRRTGAMQFDIPLDEVALTFPGTYGHQLAGVELEVDGFLPTDGIHGRLTSSGLGRYRRDDGTSQVRLQPAETMVISSFERRQDGMILLPEQGMRALFEGNSVASGWTLELPRSANDVDLYGILDIRLVLYFECRFARNLYAADLAAVPAAALAASRPVHLRFGFPDAYFELRDRGVGTLTLGPRDFPFHHTSPRLTGLALALVPEQGASLEGVELLLQRPGEAAPVTVTTGPGGIVRREAVGVAGPADALGEYRIELVDPARRQDIADIVMAMDYSFTPAV